MSLYKVSVKLVDKAVAVQPNAAALGSGFVSICTLNHPDTDPLGFTENHVAFHHVRDLMYKAGHQDMHRFKITASEITFP